MEQNSSVREQFASRAGFILMMWGILFHQKILVFLFGLAGFLSVYTDQGTVTINSGNKKIPAQIYVCKGAPYTLIGPYPFPEQKDFFFIQKNEVTGRVLDSKIADDYVLLFKWLFICFDLKGDPDSMTSCFYFDSKTKYDKKNARYVYQIKLDKASFPQAQDREISFSVPEKFLQ